MMTSLGAATHAYSFVYTKKFSNKYIRTCINSKYFYTLLLLLCTHEKKTNHFALKK